MRDDGHWWYDQNVAVGTTTDPSVNADMISPAFWLVSGREFRITRSDDSSHVPLLQTTGTVWEDKHFDQKWQVMVSLDIARFGPVTGAWETAP